MSIVRIPLKMQMRRKREVEAATKMELRIVLFSCFVKALPLGQSAFRTQMDRLQNAKTGQLASASVQQMTAEMEAFNFVCYGLPNLMLT
ncbi:unnamed protein product [Protopolystoma xenopodis]|uniref:Uncharacterized protein n=1 Tax=Protopolystoma xenopodis TaxID=117903 RepID=A0A3S5BLV1_9PLAT|nr:unnamed protein product [Protopolystoma xenopodis]